MHMDWPHRQRRRRSVRGGRHSESHMKRKLRRLSFRNPAPSNHRKSSSHFEKKKKKVLTCFFWGATVGFYRRQFRLIGIYRTSNATWVLYSERWRHRLYIVMNGYMDREEREGLAYMCWCMTAKNQDPVVRRVEGKFERGQKRAILWKIYRKSIETLSVTYPNPSRTFSLTMFTVLKLLRKMCRCFKKKIKYCLIFLFSPMFWTP